MRRPRPRDEIIFWRDVADGDQVLSGRHLATIENAMQDPDGDIVIVTRHGTATKPADALTARRIAYPPAIPGGSIDPDLLIQAATYVITKQSASAGAIQGKVRVGFGQASVLLDHLEAMGVVGAANGDKARTMLVSPDMLAEVTGRIARQAEALAD